VLDEPNSNLDNEGSQALNRAIRAMKSEGKSVLIMAHRPAAIQECDLLLMLESGQVKAFGPKDDVLKKMVQNHQQIAREPNKGSVQ
jgi:ATP-binding cassette subfamily C protein